MPAESGTNNEDEINLYDYWQVIVKRKRLIIGLFLISIITAAIVSLPKIYRGKAILIVTAKEIITAKEIVDLMETSGEEKVKSILPSIMSIKMSPLKNSTDKLQVIQVIIESKNADNIPDATSALIEYINNYPLVKQSVQQQKEKFLMQVKELSELIDGSIKVPKVYTDLLKKEGAAPTGVTKIDTYKKFVDLKIEKLMLEQAIKNLKGVEMIGQPYISKKPVKPNIKMNIALTGVVSLFTGIFLAFFIEYIERIKK